MKMTSLQHKLGTLGTPAKASLGLLAATGLGGLYYFLSTYEVRMLAPTLAPDLREAEFQCRHSA